MDLKTTQLSKKHEAAGAKMVPFAGYLMPVRYSSDIEEHQTVRNAVGIFDVSHMGEFMVSGKGALALIQRITSNDASKLTPGRAQYSCLPNDRGGIIDDLLVYMFDTDHYMLVVNASNITKDWEWITKYTGNEVDLQNVSEDISLFAVQGPKAISVLQKLTPARLDEIKFYHFVTGELAGVSDVILSATGYTGAGGFELYVPNVYAEKVWDAIMEAGKEYGIKPIGLGARDTLRMEMGYCLYGNDIDDTTSPLEAGLGWITKFDKEFINSAALKKQKEEGVTRKLVGFKLSERGIPRHDYPIYNGEGRQIGRVTSGTMSPTLQQGIGLGYVELAYSQPGSELFIEIRNRKMRAEVHKLPLI